MQQQSETYSEINNTLYFSHKEINAVKKKELS